MTLKAPALAVILTATALLSACASDPPKPDEIELEQAEQLPPSDTVIEEDFQISLDSAYRAFSSQQFALARASYQHVLDSDKASESEHRQALSGLVLVYMIADNNPLHDMRRALNTLDRLNASLALSSTPLTNAEGVIFTALRMLAEARLRVQAIDEKLVSTQQANAELVKEKVLLEEALAKLRRLSLE